MNKTLINTIDKIELKTKTIKAVIYVRVSSDEQVRKEFSIPKLQTPECINLIKASGWIFVKTYIDEGLDCNTFFKRTSLQQMLSEDIDSYDVVVVYSFDRLSGDDENTRGQIYSILDRKGKQITSVKQRVEILSPDEYDPKSLNISQQRQINSFGVSWDRKMRRERFMDSRIKTTEGGKHIVEPPYGYKMKRRIDLSNEKRTIGYRVINEEEAPTLKMIFEERVNNGLGGQRIAILLNEKGIKTRKGKEWTGARIYRVLTNPFPYGEIIWNRTQHRKYGDDKILKPIPAEKWRYIPIDRKKEKFYKPIIAKELFDKAQEMTKKNRNSGRGVFSRNILAGILKCHICGKSLVATSYYHFKKTPYVRSYLVCSNFFNKRKCINNKYRTEEVEGIVLKKVESYLKDPKELGEYQQQLRKNKLEEEESLFRNYQAKIKKSQERTYSLNMKYIDGKIKESYYKELLDVLEKEEISLRSKAIEVEDKIKEYNKRKEMIYKMKDLGKEFSSKFRNLERDKKKVILRSLIEEIKIGEDGNKKGLRNDDREKRVKEIKNIEILFKI